MIDTFRNFFKKADILLLALLVIIGLGGSFALAKTDTEGATVVVEVDGDVYGRYDLAKDQEIRIEEGAANPAGHDGDVADTADEPAADSHSEEAPYNILVIEDGTAYMKAANCHNGDCLKHRPIATTGEMIVCLPHKVVVTVEGKGGGYDTISK